MAQIPSRSIPCSCFFGQVIPRLSGELLDVDRRLGGGQFNPLPPGQGLRDVDDGLEHVWGEVHGNAGLDVAADLSGGAERDQGGGDDQFALGEGENQLAGPADVVSVHR